ncbi:hypothetical protein [uncultured Parabacteroides sp.]|uniref:hypothetical protein n=1 Tax=uncultured Parabacteroides sp. TaxID=512312 RepID=UPI0025E83B14|nr:hypothetical protein [uncultured Parabacteroides sp.]
MIQLNPIAIAATSQQYLTNVVENLCQAYCADNGVQPTGIVNFTVAEQSTVNTQTIVTVNAAVLVAYTPKGSCRTVTKQWVEQFKVAFIGAAGVIPTISLTPLITQVTPENVKCCNRAYGVSLATPLTISATFPAAPSA